MLRTFGGAPPDTTFLNVDHFKRSLVAFFKIPFVPREIEEIFQTLSRNGNDQLHEQDFIDGFRPKLPSPCACRFFTSISCNFIILHFYREN